MYVLALSILCVLVRVPLAETGVQTLAWATCPHLALHHLLRT